MIVLFVAGGLFSQVSNERSIAHQQHSVTQADVKTVVVFDGATNPDSIPDNVAFTYLFRLLVRNPLSATQEADDARRKAYLTYFFRKDCGPAGVEDRSLTEAEQDALLKYADSIAAKITGLDTAGQKLPPTEAITPIITTAMRELDLTLGPDVARKLRSHVNDRLKPRIKIVQSTMPSGK